MRENRTSLRYNVILPLREAKKMLGKLFLRLKNFLVAYSKNTFWSFLYFYSKERRKVYRKANVLEKRELRKDVWKNVLSPFDKFMMQRDWYAYLTDAAFRAKIAEKFRREQTNVFGVVLTWIIEESWWAVVSKVIFWYYNELFPWYAYWKWTLKEQRRATFSKRKMMERYWISLEARDYLQAKYGDRVYKSDDFSLLFFRYFWMFSNEGTYASDWVTAKETERLSFLYFHKLFVLETVRKLPFLQAQLLAFVFNEKEAQWAKHWASAYVTQERYLFLQEHLKRIYKFLLKYFGPFVYFFSVIVQNYIDGFVLMRIAIQEIWEDYYVFLYRDEWNYIRIGIIVFFQEGFSFIFRTDDLFEIFTFRYWYDMPYFKAIRTFLWLFVDDVFTGFCYSVLVIDLITRPLVGKVWRRSFLENVNIWVANPIIRIKEDLDARFYFISKLGLREGIKAYYFSKFLKGFFQLGRVSNRAIFPWEGKIIRKARQIEDLQNVAFDYRAYKNKKKIIDYIYEGFNQTFNTFIELVCDPEELKDYRTRKYDAARKERTTLSNPWQYWNRWRVFKAWRVLNEDLDNYGIGFRFC